ncbi:hypothetical protein [Psychrosphaera haliotis]|uniref:Uncharacterized protein n=1 Tax=Psychrosphaera haliotis TaxID=555083 RepID=A0A6N8F9N8_9GAMM|nr:hypothetical protein [Psychrosphaera haliotis]MUH72988.1 hypothetical protein [Psychrosphaera haliotis]
MTSNNPNLPEVAFLEASQFYSELANHVEDLSIRHGLIKVSSVFQEIHEKVGKWKTKSKWTRPLHELFCSWNNNLNQMRVGNTSTPELSLLEQRLQVESANLSKLRKAFKESEPEQEKRYIADLIATYFNVVDILTKMTRNQKGERYA